MQAIGAAAAGLSDSARSAHSLTTTPLGFMNRRPRKSSEKQDEKAIEQSKLFALLRERANNNSTSKTPGTKDKRRGGIETYSILVGQPESGKSSLLALLQTGATTKEPAPTFLLDYVFARKTSKSDPNVKDVAHIWELGSGLEFEDLMDIALPPSRLPKCGLIGIVIDLSTPAQAVGWARRWLLAATARIERHVQTLTRDDPQAAKALAAKKLPSKVPILLIANKCDRFKNVQPALKKVIAQALRALAQYHSAGLHYVSINDKTAFRNTFGAALFHKADKHSKQNTKPDAEICVPAGTDSFEDINTAGPLDPMGPGPEIKLAQTIKRGLAQFFDDVPYFFDDIHKGDDYAEDENLAADEDKYAEPKIDQFYNAKLDEIAKYLEEVERTGPTRAR